MDAIQNIADETAQRLIGDAIKRIGRNQEYADLSVGEVFPVLAAAFRRQADALESAVRIPA